MTETATMTRAPQRLQALSRANEIRLARAELKRRIAEGQVSAAQVILDPPAEVHNWSVGELLMTQRRWGTTRCRKFLMRNQISETRPVGALTERQRAMLAAALGAAVPPRSPSASTHSVSSPSAVRPALEQRDRRTLAAVAA